jgi:AcrR family transcriptional regulator
MKAAAGPRRNPRQERSKITVNAILEAAARVWATRDFGATSTNQIAQRAGVSVGSLYQYFPNKEALLRALHDRQHELLMARMTAAARAGDASLETALQSIIAAAVEHHRAHAPLVRVFARHLPPDLWPRPAAGGSVAFQASLRELLHLHRAELQVADLDLVLFFLKNIGRSVMHSAAKHRPGDLASGVIQRELHSAALAYLTGREPPAHRRKQRPGLRHQPGAKS